MTGPTRAPGKPKRAPDTPTSHARSTISSPGCGPTWPNWRSGRDARRFFHATYLRTTEAVADEIARGGSATPTGCTLGSRLRPASTSTRWTPIVGARRCRGRGGWPSTPPAISRTCRRCDTSCSGLNAHINYDLPQALLAVIPVGRLRRPGLVAPPRGRPPAHRHRAAGPGRRGGRRTHRGLPGHVARPAAAPGEPPGQPTVPRRGPGEGVAQRQVLDGARRRGQEQYAAALAALESRCADRVRDLVRPGFVLLRLALRGFGVVLPAES